MPIQTSPSVAVTEKDYSQVVTFAPSGEGAIAGNFTSGPILEPVLISSVSELETIFGTPTDTNYRDWYSAYNFLQYSSKLWIIRIKPVGVMNAADTAGIEILNNDDYELKTPAALLAAGNFICRQPGTIGNNLTVYAVDSGNWAAFDTDTYMSEGRRISAYLNGAPGTTQYVEDKYGAAMKDEVHIVVIDRTGAITGVPGRILEIMQGLSKANDIVDYLGRNIYYASFINTFSKWIYWGAHSTTVSAVLGEHAFGLSASVLLDGNPFKTYTAVIEKELANGVAGTLAWGTSLDAALQDGLDLLSDKDGINVTFILTSNAPVSVQTYAIQSIAEPRRDCIAFVTPHDGTGEPFMDKTTLLSDLLTFRNTTLNINSSFAVIDSGFKYQFDGYNQKWRWVPLNGDVAGLCARLDVEYDAWQSPAGFTRGNVKNALKLSSVLNQAARDQLYPKGVNAIVSFSGKGTVLFGDRTMQSKSSAFQYIHIRRLFIILEKAIEDAAKYSLFELNNETTRNNFATMVSGFLESVKAKDGLDDFAVVCDRTNNSDDSIARGEFIADIYIKPLYSIQFIVLNFVATKSSVQFNTSTR